MIVGVKRIDDELPLPEYKTKGAAAVDLYAREDVGIQAGEVGYVPLNIVTKIPKGYFGLLLVRSSTHKIGIMPVNGMGIIDGDYCGEYDEWKLAAWNFTKELVEIKKGTRVAQMLILKQEQMVFVEKQKMENKSRGGFGSTGK